LHSVTHLFIYKVSTVVASTIDWVPNMAHPKVQIPHSTDRMSLQGCFEQHIRRRGFAPGVGFHLQSKHHRATSAATALHAPLRISAHLRRGSWIAAAAASTVAAADDEPSSSSDGSDATDAAPATKKGGSSLGKRALFGTILGVSGAGVIVAGGWIYAVVTCLVAYQCSKEFIGLVNAKGISAGMKPPPPAVSAAISLLCVALNAWSYYSGGKAATAMAVASFLVLSLQLLVGERPKFSQLTSSVFGLVYCGYLPSFWIKLRLLSAPAVNSTLLHQWPVRPFVCVIYTFFCCAPSGPICNNVHQYCNGD
jgi:hypothetical protein